MNREAASAAAVSSTGVRPVIMAGNRRRVRLTCYILLMMADVVAILVSFFSMAWFVGEVWLTPRGFHLGLLFAPLYFVLAMNRNAYAAQVIGDFSESVRRMVAALILTLLIVALIGLATQTGVEVSRRGLGLAVIAAAVLMVISRWALLRWGWRRMEGVLADVLLIDDGGPVPDVDKATLIDGRSYNIRPDLNDPRRLQQMARLMAGFDRVVVATVPEREQSWSMLLKASGQIGEIVLSRGNTIGMIGVDHLGDADTAVVSRGPLDITNRFKKRMLDLALTIPALIFLAPLMLIVALAIVIESPGPIFFSQPRVGRGNRMFSILKFRSMRPERLDHSGAQSTRRDDDRVTRVGSFIRKTSIDELPQLINVLRGDMSLVGPRPHALGSLAGDKLFWEVDPRYWLRHALKPGITGLAQVRGLRGATHRREDLQGRLQADLEYLNQWTLWRDITILVGTVRVLVHPNAY